MLRKCQVPGIYEDYLPSQKSPGKIGVAVSGGPDSMALAFLLKEAFGSDRIVAYVLDHGMSKVMGITEHVEETAAGLKAMGITAETIYLRVDTDEGPTEANPSSSESNETFASVTRGKLVERCREARYQALLEASIRNQTRLVVTGHNLDDDIVTMFYRMAHLSGLDGLAGMKAIGPFPISQSHRMSQDFMVGHPLLPVPKARLLETVRAAGVPIWRDASNEDLDYRRNSVHTALCSLQQMENQQITTERLAAMLGRLKTTRATVHGELVKIYESSVIVNRINGDNTLILNQDGAGALIKRKRYLLLRLISALMQYAGCSRYPARTPSLTQLVKALEAAFNEHQSMQNARIPKRLKGREGLEDRYSPVAISPFDQTKRVNQFKQHTIGGCIVYALSRADAQRRISLQERIFGRKLNYGPSFLIQRDPPSTAELSRARNVTVKLAPGETFLWDDRIFLTYTTNTEAESTQSKRAFTISHMCTADLRAFELITTDTPALRRRVYAFVGITPGSHLYQIPVVREPETGYLGFPTLNVGAYDPHKRSSTAQPIAKWSTHYAGLNFLTSKFLCLP